MKYRIMTNDKITDFNTKAEADILFASEKTKVEKAEITTVNGMKKVPTASIHICYHDETHPRPCVIIEKVEAKEKV